MANMQKMTPQKYFPVFARVRIQALHVFAEKLIPQEILPACIGFVPGGNPKNRKTTLNLANFPKLDLRDRRTWDIAVRMGFV